MIRKYLFLFFFFLGISIISIVFLPSLVMPIKIVLFGGKMMGNWAALCLKIFLKTKIIVKGRDNIVKNEKLQNPLFYLCGWRNMIVDAKQQLSYLGFDSSNIKLELYG